MTYKLTKVKAALLLILGSANTGSVLAQEPISETWIYQNGVMSTVHQVGIGTDAPSDALEVKGNVTAYDPVMPGHLVTKRHLDGYVESLQQADAALGTKAQDLEAQLQALQNQYNQLRTDHNNLQSAHWWLQNDYLNLLARVEAIEDKLTPKGRNCLDIKTMEPTSATGFYLIDPDGAEVGVLPFKVWCDMDYQGGGWTLFANHKDGIENIQQGELISPESYSVMNSERWVALRATTTGGMMFKDEHGRISQLNQAKVNDANCRNIYTEDNLAQLSTLGDYGLIWHHEDTNCDVSLDFSGVILGDKDSTRAGSYTYQGASVIQAPNSTVRFDVWPYGSDESSRNQQNELQYFIK
ncbi:fibrinogen-like YCDxxxxGGGW domain-containing protein [Pseudoalteromonas byunsanensis]|uniref:Fibrinogen C-terminal domain-containing protein n=1 Tax=Pseudoalteromonas byunsanensis TaxID=327939 RepID=A0A1S1N6Y6_9GAMM|nr:fibrinogen-like YCDxxxxGGGW domain-containing protein [Pseudoalteromonas byunsanensis]OHU94021.1 hypothetical protein BIW53_17530 [Pseudoalteromonas byunsanensis]